MGNRPWCVPGDDAGCHWHVCVLLQEWETVPGDDEGCHWHACVLLQEWETDPGDDEGCHWHACVLLQEWETDPGVSLVMMKAVISMSVCCYRNGRQTLVCPWW